MRTATVHVYLGVKSLHLDWGQPNPSKPLDVEMEPW
jgi:hypothetical protein